MKTKLLCMILTLTLAGGLLSAQNVSATVADASALVSGYEAYRNEDWTSAMFFFRKAVAVSGGSTDETWYMLIMSEMYAGEYKNALGDCDSFMRSFSFSMYLPYIHYQKGRCQHFLQQNENAVLTLSDFCHQYPGHDLYASALYWIAESFYAEYNYDAARALYERIVMDFPRDTKVGASQYRIDAIDQKSREEKLLYLLKVTGEENLAAREDYERQLKLYEAEDKLGLRQQLSEARLRIESLEDELDEARALAFANARAAEDAANAAKRAGTRRDESADGVHDIADDAFAASSGTASAQASDAVSASGTAARGGRTPLAGYDASSAADASAYPLSDPEVEALKRKARQLQYILDEQKKSEDAK